jgi:glycosyltransferase involved in cell wall biosynthesis
VPRAIDSVLAQKNVNVELVVVDDNSQDGTYDLLSGKYKNNIKLIGLNRNKGVAHATNVGFKKSIGEYIALLGDDDYWIDTRKLEKQISCFKQTHSNLGVVGTWWYEEKNGVKIAREPIEPKNWEEKLLKGGGVICGSTPLIRREIWITAGGLDEKMHRGTDSDLFRRIILKGYTGTIIKEHTTVVDVGHCDFRITTVKGFSAAARLALVHAYLIWKYKSYYVRYPVALLKRMKSLITTPLITVIGE